MTQARPRPTLQQVANRAGVSIATASYVLSGRLGRGTGVGPEATTRVHDAAGELGYRQSGHRSRSRTAIISVTNLRDPFSLSLVSTVQEALAPHGIQPLLVTDGDWRRAVGRQTNDLVILDEVDESPAGRRALARLVARGERLVVWSRVLPARGFDVIRSADGAGIALAVRYLHHTYGTVGYLAGPVTAPNRGHRFEVFRTTMHELGVRSPRGWEPTFDLGPAAVFAAARRLLARKDRPRAVLAHTDLAAVTALGAAQSLGLQVPGDVAIMGAGAAHLNPPLTSVGALDLWPRLAELVQQRVRARTYAPAVHEFDWVIHRRGATA